MSVAVSLRSTKIETPWKVPLVGADRLTVPLPVIENVAPDWPFPHGVG